MCNNSPQNYVYVLERQTKWAIFFENRINILIFVLMNSVMNVKGYEEYLLLKRSVESLVAELEKMRERVTETENELAEVKSRLSEKNEEVRELQTRYERAKFSGAILGSGEDAMKAKRKVSELVREIEKCIALLDR